MAPPMNANPLATARYLSGRISEGMACTILIVDRVVPMRIPPTMSMLMDVALAYITAPTKATSGGTAARCLRSSTSESLPTMGDSTLCINSGPYRAGRACQLPKWQDSGGSRGAKVESRPTCMIQPEMEASPKSRTMKATTEPAATTTKTWAMMLSITVSRATWKGPHHFGRNIRITSDEDHELEIRQTCERPQELGYHERTQDRQLKLMC